MIQGSITQVSIPKDLMSSLYYTLTAKIYISKNTKNEVMLAALAMIGTMIDFVDWPTLPILPQCRHAEHGSCSAVLGRGAVSGARNGVALDGQPQHCAHAL